MPDAPAETAAPAKTDYLVLRHIPLASEGVDGGWVVVGQYTVPAGRADKAKARALGELAAQFPDADSHELTTVASGGWKPQKFVKPSAPPAFVPAK